MRLAGLVGRPPAIGCHTLEHAEIYQGFEKNYRRSTSIIWYCP